MPDHSQIPGVTAEGDDLSAPRYQTGSTRIPGGTGANGGSSRVMTAPLPLPCAAGGGGRAAGGTGGFGTGSAAQKRSKRSAPEGGSSPGDGEGKRPMTERGHDKRNGEGARGK